ncbi:MAG: hypothetical protein ACE5NG_15340 [bacterium]
MNKKLIPVKLILILLVSVTSLFAQASRLEFIREQFLRPSIHFKTWSFDEESGFDRFTEVAFPVTYSLPVNARLGLDVVALPFLSSLNPVDGESFTLNNITDTILRASYILGEDLALLTIGVGIPSGKSELDEEELRIAGIAANRPLNNPVTNFGTGVNLNFALAIAQEVGPWVLGAGFGYSLRGKYDVLVGTQEVSVEPGNEFNITFGVDRDFEMANGNAKFTADIVYTNYSEDELEGVPFFEAGDKLVVQGRFLFPFARFDPVIISVLNRWRLDNESINSALIDNGNEFEVGATIFHPFGNRFSLKYLINSIIYSDTVDDTEGAFVIGVGGGFLYRLSDYISIDPTFRFFKGSINTGQGSDISMTGFEFSGGLSLRF